MSRPTSVRIGDRQAAVKEYSISGRRLFIVDDVVRDEVVDGIDGTFRALPFSLTDVDRPDTAHVRHFVYRFPQDELVSDGVVSTYAAVGRAVLELVGERAGEIRRAYVNCNLHGDLQFKHRDGEEWTCLAFLNSRWDTDWGGELLMYPEAPDEPALAVAPRPKRMVVFDGLIEHRGGVPSKLCFDPRLSLAIKMGYGD